MYVTTLKPGQTVRVGKTVLTVRRQRGQSLHLAIDAPWYLRIRKGGMAGSGIVSKFFRRFTYFWT